MSITSTKEEVNKEDIKDDVSDQNVQEKSQDEVDDEILARLQAKKAKKETGEDMPPKIVQEVERAYNFGIVGSGQCGGRLAQCFYNLGYPAIALNTAQQDLKHIEIPDANKLLLDMGIGGAAKDLDTGSEAAESYRDAISELMMKKLGDSEMIIFCTSLGGGSGAGSTETIVNILAAMEVPVAVITVLPQSSDDAQTKHNALMTLSRLSKMAQERKIDNLIVADNSKIEQIYSDVSQLNFFDISNKAIVEPIDVFNKFSVKPSPVKALDDREFGKLFSDGQGLTTYGYMDVPNYEDVDALADAIIDNLDGTLLAGGFDLKQARYVGVMFVASQRVWDRIPQAATNYAMAMVNDACGTPQATFKGIYTVDTDEDVVKVYSMFSGLGLPEGRVSELKAEAKQRMQASEKKDDNRNLTLNLDSGESSMSEADRIKNRIKNKKSGLGKLKKSVIDRRK